MDFMSVLIGAAAGTVLTSILTYAAKTEDIDAAWHRGFKTGYREGVRNIIAADTATTFSDPSEGDELAQWGGCYPHCRKEGD